MRELFSRRQLHERNEKNAGRLCLEENKKRIKKTMTHLESVFLKKNFHRCRKIDHAVLKSSLRAL